MTLSVNNSEILFFIKFIKNVFSSERKRKFLLSYKPLQKIVSSLLFLERNKQGTYSNEILRKLGIPFRSEEKTISRL